ncbi:MAG: sirohydrochlorin cobaltochelatase [Deltaproteobacteria bacterium]
MKTWYFLAFAIFIASVFSSSGEAMDKKKDTAIVLAMFGTTYPEAISDLAAIKDHVKNAFPDTEVRISFTSHQIRKIWQQRKDDPEWQKRTDIPAEFMDARGLLATVGDLQDAGYRQIVIQPTHLYHGEQFMDLAEYVRGLNSIRTVKKKWMPFSRPIALGRPLLGTWGDLYAYHEDMKQVAEAISPLVEKAREEKAALVLMAHGNEHMSSGIYGEFERVVSEVYPHTCIVIGSVEGYPGIDRILEAVRQRNIKKAVLAPFMIVAGDHARNDMTGPDADSWMNQLERKGVEVIPVLQGLGRLPGVGEIFVRHIRDAAQEEEIQL